MTKKVHVALLIAITGVMIFSSCTKKNESPASLSPQITVTINGTVWTTTSVFAKSIYNGIEIDGLGDVGNNISIIIPSPSPGNYVVGSNSSTAISLNQNNVGYSSQSGLVIVNSFSNYVITGTFIGDCWGGVGSHEQQLKNGSFTAQVQ